MVAEERTSWNSGGGSCCWDFGVPRSAWVAPGGVMETIISRHSMVGGAGSGVGDASSG